MPAMTSATMDQVRSLLPFLQPRDQGFRLRLNVQTRCHADAATALLPDQETGPFCDLFLAQLMFDSQVVGEHLLLMQPDHYRLPVSDFRSICNTDTEIIWQRAVAQAALSGPVVPSAAPSSARDAPERPSVYRPLFYCCYRRLNAHSLCPTCGTGLDVCRDDHRLHDSGLPSFSSSLERFLYCPCCALESVAAVYYAPSPPAGAGDVVVPGRELIRSWGRLTGDHADAADLPCIGCTEAAECYRADGPVEQRLRPLRFFPFFMMLQPASTLPALEAMRQSLFHFRFDMPPAPSIDTPMAVASPHQKIKAILGEILDRWPMPSLASPASASPPVDAASVLSAGGLFNGMADDQAVDIEETVVLTSLEKTVPGADRDMATEELEQTVVFTPAGGELEPVDPAAELEKTRIITPGFRVAEPPAAPTADTAGDLDETVVLAGSGSRPADDQLSETVLIEPGVGQDAARRPPAMSGGNLDDRWPPPASDDLEATVIIRPADPKNRKHKP